MPAFRRIICPVDFSAATEAALTVAATLAHAYEAELMLLHVLDFPHETVALERYYLEIEDEARRRLGELGHDAGFAGLRVRGDVLRGTPYDAIARFAERESAELIVMATHGRTGLDRLIVGSVTERVARTSPCPVLTVPPGFDTAGVEGFEPRRIVFATDFSPAADAALPYARSLATALATDLCFVHVVTFGERGHFGAEWHVASMPERVEQERLQAAGSGLDERAESARGQASVDTRLIRGTYPAVEIAEYAEEVGAGIIVVASHGSAAVRRVLLGSTTEKLLRMSPVPVFIVRID